MKPFCVYITTYSGKLLPPYYIGSTTVVKQNLGYVGSVRSKAFGKIWQNELIDHPDLFSSKIVSLHETRQEAVQAERALQEYHGVPNNNLFVNRALAGKLFFFNGHHTKEAREAIGAASRRPKSQSHRQKISEALSNKPKSPEHRKALCAAWNSRDRTVSTEQRAKISSALVTRKRLASTKKKISLKLKGTKSKNAKRCTIDGITVFRSARELASALGGGKNGVRHPNFRFLD